jgi:hypothetical protein
MANCTIRVELHDANWQHYTDLANDLARKGITDLIAAVNGVTYKMSPGEYNYEGNASIDDVVNAVVESANKTGKANAVFVTEAVTRKWIGLQPAQARRTA